jgi:hypothetical protein
MKRIAALGAILVVLRVLPALADDAFLAIPVPPDLTAYVEGVTGRTLPTDLTIGVVDNDSPLLKTHNVVVAGISVTAGAAEEKGKIYLPVYNIVRLEEAAIRALVVHELVHVTQEGNGKKYACQEQREAEAYAVQNKFLQDRGLPPVLDERIIGAFRLCKEMGGE